MNRIACISSAVGLLVLITAPAFPADNPKPPSKPKPPPVHEVFRLPKEIALGPEQKAKLQELIDEYGLQVSGLDRKYAAIVSDEQKKAREEAAKEARAAGKDKKGIQAAIEAAAPLSDEQKKQQAEVADAIKVLHRQIRDKIESFLYPYQLEQLHPKKKKKP